VARPRIPRFPPVLARAVLGFGSEPDSPVEESGFEPSVPLGEKRSFRNASIRELHRVTIGDND
jgi:hypothetical protein